MARMTRDEARAQTLLRRQIRQAKYATVNRPAPIRKVA